MPRRIAEIPRAAAVMKINKDNVMLDFKISEMLIMIINKTIKITIESFE